MRNVLSRLRDGGTALMLLAAWSLASVTAGWAATVHVAHNGNDQWSGNLAAPSADGDDGPLATLTQAQSKVRALIAAGLKEPVEVVIHGGTYELAQTLTLTSQDSGTQACPITWRAADGERVVLRGTRQVTGWKPWQGKIMQADLGAQGLGDLPFHQLFYQPANLAADGFAQRMVLARYPNVDPQHPRTGGFLYVAAEADPQARKTELGYAPGDLPLDRWTDIPQAEVVSGYWRSWQFCIAPIVKIDDQRHMIQFQELGHARGQFFKLNHYFIQNILAELDSPGEWYLDRAKNILYFWPPEDGAMGRVLVPVLDHIIVVQGALPYPYEWLNTAYQGKREDAKLPADAPAPDPVQFVNFTGLDFECAEQDGIRLSGVQDGAVTSCRVTNVGSIGINLGAVAPVPPEEGNPRRVPATGFLGGQGAGGHWLLYNDPVLRTKVTGCDVWSTGCEGIAAFGQDDVVENNHVHDIGLYNKDVACVSIHGDRQVARRNTVHDAPRFGVFVKCVDGLVELNDIHHVALETIDVAGIYIVQRNTNLRGNIFRYNKIADVHGYGFDYEKKVQYATDFFTWNIYLDDYTSGTLVEGNILLRASRGGIMCNGGGDNVLRNNIIVDQRDSGLLFRQMGQNLSGRKNVAGGNHAENNIVAFLHPWPNTTPVVYRFGAFQPYSLYATFKNNLIWAAPGTAMEIHTLRAGVAQPEVFTDLQKWFKPGRDETTRRADPLFVNPAADDYRLKPDSPAWALGFKAIPVEQIGCYQARERRTWPLADNLDRWREEPVLYGIKPGADTLKESNLPQ